MIGPVAMRMSILLRLTLWNASVVALLLITFAGAGWFTLARVVQQRTTSVVRESARAVAGAILAERRAAAARGEIEKVRGEHEQAVLRELRSGDLDIFITDEAAQLMAARLPGPEAARTDRDADAVRIPPAVRALMDDVRRDREAGRLSDSALVVRDVMLDEGPARAAVLRVEPAELDEAGEPALLVTALRMRAEDDLLLRQVRTTIFFAIPMALLVSIAAGFALARRSLAPLEAINSRTASITASRLDERLPVVNPHDELGRLAQIINALLGRVDTAFRTQRQFVADASHELRTPLAIIRGEADVTLRRESRPEGEYREALQVIQSESVRLTRIVDDLFLLARVDAGSTALSKQPVAIDELLHDAVRSVRSLAEAQQVAVVLDVGSDTPSGAAPDAYAAARTIAGDAVLLHRLLLNLLDNALKHAPAGTSIVVTLYTDMDSVRVRVADQGPGIAAAVRDRIFERFVHGVPADAGAGLGLAIAQAIAQAHGGQITLLDQAPGATFQVLLPTLPSAGVSA